jgi:hypothetical protein
LNAVEIEQAISLLAEQPFDASTFPYAFLEAFGNKPTVINRLKNSNKSDVPNGVLQHNNIHMAMAPVGRVDETLTQLRQSPHLILHQGNQGRDHHRHPIQTQRGNLITQGFSRPRGHHNKGILTADDMLNNRLLLSPKRGIAKGFLQDADGCGHGEGCWGKK